MKKKILLRGLIGLPVGISIGHLISVITSLIWGGGAYSPCVPELVSSVGNEVGAVLLQTILCAIIGAVFAGASLIWEIERWSIARQTGVYFLFFFPPPISCIGWNGAFGARCNTSVFLP